MSASNVTAMLSFSRSVTACKSDIGAAKARWPHSGCPFSMALASLPIRATTCPTWSSSPCSQEPTRSADCVSFWLLAPRRLAMRPGYMAFSGRDLKKVQTFSAEPEKPGCMAWEGTKPA